MARRPHVLHPSPATAPSVVPIPTPTEETVMTPRVIPDNGELANSSRAPSQGRYSPGSPHSWFRDLALVAARNQRREAALDNPILRGLDQGDPDLAASIMSPKDLDEVETRIHFEARA